jgi:hypothetical protein
MFKINNIVFHFKKIEKKRVSIWKEKNDRDRSGRAGGVPQVVEHLPTKHEVLTSNTSISKKRKEEQIAQIWIMTGRQLRLDSTDPCLGLFTLGVSASISCIMVGE